jgi:hypothetical protein
MRPVTYVYLFNGKVVAVMARSSLYERTTRSQVTTRDLNDRGPHGK